MSSSTANSSTKVRRDRKLSTLAHLFKAQFPQTVKLAPNCHFLGSRKMIKHSQMFVKSA